MASALSCCSWPQLALVFPMICAWHYQGLRQCTRPVGHGLIKYRWFADHSFHLPVCMISRSTVYDITLPLVRFPHSHMIHWTAICPLLARFFGSTVMLDYYWYRYPTGARRRCSQTKSLREQSDYGGRTLETSFLVRRVTERITDTQTDMLRRVLVALDRAASSGLGRPCALQDEE